MKVLILVQSVNKGRYPELRKVQQDTWDSVKHPNIDTMYYYPDFNIEQISGKDMIIKGPENWGYMFMQCMKAFRTALTFEWDFLFKTDNSAYVSKHELYQLLSTKPKSKFYGGHKLISPKEVEKVKEDVAFLWGEGVALSRDVVEMLVDMYLVNPTKRMGVEDVHIGHILGGKFPWDETMTIHEYNPSDTIKRHVYRCRITDGVVFDDDIKSMKRLYQSFTGSQVSL